MLMYSPVAVMSLVITCRVISVATELLRTSTGCTNPSFSLMIYVDWLKLTDTAIMYKKYLARYIVIFKALKEVCMYVNNENLHNINEN